MRSATSSLFVRPAGAVAIAALAVALTGCAASTAGSTPTATHTPTPTATAAAWSYEGSTGPEHWGDFAKLCAASASAQQSPIDIATTGISTDEAALAVRQYLPFRFALEDTGHSIEAVADDKKAQTLTIDGVTYALQQFHFHAESEHTIDGQHAAAEIHLVHTSDDGKIAVVGIPITVGSENPALSELFSSIPKVAGTDRETELKNSIDLSSLLAADAQVVRYEGSLTTPPCSESVKWTVSLTPMTVSPAQLAALTSAYAHNARPVQPVNGRTVQPGSLG